MADDFEALAKSIHRVFPGSLIKPATEEQLDTIRHAQPAAPTHYLDFLRRVGWGSLGNGNFMIYSGLCKPTDIFDEVTAAELAGVLFLGDNFGGWMVGFDTSTGWRLVSVDCSAKPHPLEHRSLAELVAQRVADAQEAEPGAVQDPAT